MSPWACVECGGRADDSDSPIGRFATGTILASMSDHPINFLDELAWRGLLHQTTSPELAAHLASGSRTGYCGFDPTSDSLTVGNLLPVTLLHALPGRGASTDRAARGRNGLIGDPSGKTSERSLQSEDQVAANLAGQRRILERLLG